MYHVWGRGEAYTGFWWGKPKEKRPLGRPKRRREDNINMDLQKWHVRAWTGSMWLRIRTDGRHL